MLIIYLTLLKYHKIYMALEVKNYSGFTIDRNYNKEYEDIYMKN